jgi:hypothetical protein
MANFPADEGGSYIYEFDSPLTIAEGQTFSGLKVQRRVSEWVNTDTAKEIALKYGVNDRCIKRVVTYEVDLDELYACNQEGLIPDEELDSIMESNVTYALVRVKV